MTYRLPVVYMPSVNLQGSSYVRNSSGEVANSKYGLEPMYAAPKAKNSTPKIGSPTSGVKNGPATRNALVATKCIGNVQGVQTHSGQPKTTGMRT